MSETTQDLEIPTWADMSQPERGAYALGLAIMIAGVLAGPHILCWVSGCTPSATLSGVFYDAVIVELLGMALLILWPLKVALKRWLYEDDGVTMSASFTRRALAVTWVVAVLGVTALCVPQGFFWLTARPMADGVGGLGRDTLAASAALVPQLVGVVPYVWAVKSAMNRAVRETPCQTVDP